MAIARDASVKAILMRTASVIGIVRSWLALGFVFAPESNAVVKHLSVQVLCRAPFPAPPAIPQRERGAFDSHGPFSVPVHKIMGGLEVGGVNEEGHS